MSRLLPALRAVVLAPLAAAMFTSAAAAQTAPGVTFKLRTQLKNNGNPARSKPDSVALKRRQAALDSAANLAATSGADVGDAPPVGGRGGAPGGGGGAAGGRGGQNNVTTMTGAFVKGLGRLDVIGTQGNPDVGATQSVILTDTSTTIIDDIQKNWQAKVFDIGSILAFTGAVDRQDSTNKSVAKIGMLKASWETLADTTYESRPAKHYRLHMAYGFTQPARLDSAKILSVTDVISDYWVVNLPVNFENRFAGIGRPRKPIPDSLRGEWAKILQLYAELGKGTIVKFVATGVINENSAGTPTEYTRTMDMTGIKDTDVDVTRLKVPADYERAATGRGRGGDLGAATPGTRPPAPR